MLWYGLVKHLFIPHCYKEIPEKNIKNKLDKDKLSRQRNRNCKRPAKAFLFASFSGSLSLEAALVLPVFLLVIVTVLQYGKMLEQAVKIDTSLAHTAKTMSIAAHLKNDIGDIEKVPQLAQTVVTAGAAQLIAEQEAGDTSAMAWRNMTQSSFMNGNEIIDLVYAFQIKAPFSMISTPWTFYVERARVRAWTGRTPDRSKKDAESEAETEGQKVYVTATGSVYHTDANCTHLRLSTQAVKASALGEKRNKNGAKYHACEKCGSGTPTGTVYITNEGTKYHTTKDCSGLKRSVSEQSISEIGSKRACSRCSK